MRERLGDPRAVPGFRCTFHPGMPSSMTPGSSNIDKFQSSDVDIGLRRDLSGSALPKSRNPFRAGLLLRGYTGSLPLRPVRLLAPLHGSDRLPGQRGLLHPGLQRGRHVAGHDYNSDWTPLLAGLSPAGMAASLAAPDPYVSLSTYTARATTRRLPPSVERGAHPGVPVGPNQRR